MKKIISLLLMIAIAGVFAAGCSKTEDAGGGGGSDTTTDSGSGGGTGE